MTLVPSRTDLDPSLATRLAVRARQRPAPEPRDMPPGWWLLPALVLGLVFWGGVIALIF